MFIVQCSVNPPILIEAQPKTINTGGLMVYWTEMFGTTCLQIQPLTDTRMSGVDGVWTP